MIPIPSPASPAILLVEDDIGLRNEMADYLSGHGCRTFHAGDTHEARAALKAHAIDVVVLDVNLPGEDGLSLCRTITAGEGPAVLMASALGDPIDRILGLELGADDYMVKPIVPRELLARVKAIAKRSAGRAPTNAGKTYQFAGFRFDPSARRLLAPGGAALLLTRGELVILTTLVDNPRAVVSRDELARRGGDEGAADGRGIDLHISRLRRKLHAHAAGELIKTQRGLGYVLDVVVRAS